jgi:hypothetical protein
VSDDLDRWVNLEGPEPDGVRELLDRAHGGAELTPEQQARLDDRLYAAIAEHDRRRASQRAMVGRITKGAGILAIAAAVALAVRFLLMSDRQAVKPAPTDHRRAREIPTVTAPDKR